MAKSKRSLICITSCNRIFFAKALVYDYLNFINYNESFDFLLALDGANKEYISFCEEYDIPLLYSQEREGVGMTKNRVYNSFPDYDYYFFIEDDAELFDSNVFAKVIDVAERTNIHHFSLGEDFRFFGNRTEQDFEDVTIIHSQYGSGVFNFFTKYGLSQVGGWHDEFAKYKRYGHTEHSMRFQRNNLAPAPFNVIKELINGYFLWHNPESVTINNSIQLTAAIIASPEVAIINEKLLNYPFNVISNGYFNNKDVSTYQQLDRLASELYDHRILFYKSVLTMYFEAHNKKVTAFNNLMEEVKASYSYRIGKKLIYPFTFLKRLL